MSVFYEEIKDFIKIYTAFHIEYSNIGSEIILISGKNIAFNLIENGKYILSPQTIPTITEQYYSRGIQLIHIWEDIWITRKVQVKSIIKAKLGFASTIFARKTEIVKLTKPELDDFLNQNHLMGTTSCKHKYGLKYNGELVAATAWGPIRKYYYGDKVNNSAELIRYANLNDILVTGGLSKLISHYIKEYHPDDIMTYIDKDWSNGEVYRMLGFSEKETTPPKAFILDNQFKRNVLNDTSQPKDIIYNSGNIKFIKYLD